MADKYRRVEKSTPEQPSNPNEIRLTAVGRRKNYISYAIGKLTAENNPERSLTLKGKISTLYNIIAHHYIIHVSQRHHHSHSSLH